MMTSTAKNRAEQQNGKCASGEVVREQVIMEGPETAAFEKRPKRRKSEPCSNQAGE